MDPIYGKVAPTVLNLCLGLRIFQLSSNQNVDGIDVHMKLYAADCQCFIACYILYLAQDDNGQPSI